MHLAITPLTDATTWARGDGLEIVLLVLGSLLLARVVGWTGSRLESRIDTASEADDALVRSEDAKHRHAVVQVITYVVVLLVWTVAAVLVLERLGVPVTTLTAPAAAIGVALGLGAQKFVQDVLAGFFVVTERQYGYGDVITVNVGAGIAAVTGTVEDVTLRSTRIRTLDGEVVITSNGSVLQVTNLSRDWARAVIDVPVPVEADVAEITERLAEVGRDAFADPSLRALLLDEPTVMGVESLQREQLNIRVVARTLPGKQFDVGRDLRSRIAAALRDQGVVVPLQVEATPSTSTAGSTTAAPGVDA